jgi:NAD(P)-dependent dehydrogenase (short-subunit alcohol dehydrogenase family)
MTATRIVVVLSYSLDDRVALVTGAGSGIGEAAAKLLATRGLEIGLVGRREDRLRAVAAAIEDAGGRTFCVPADLGEPRAPWAVIDAVLDRCRRLDVIVNNAATYRLKPIDRFSLEDFDEVMATNLRAPYFLVQAALPALRASPAAVIVNVSSAAAAMYRPQQTVYGLAKAALEHMTMNMAAELAPDRIRVACVRPGPVLTEFHLAAEDPEERVRVLETLVPLGRIGQPEDIARWIDHLVDVDADWVTGVVISVDGGRVLGPPGV